MCGIIGYSEKRGNVGEILLGGMKKLEYRGYDLCDMAVINDGMVLRKETGKV